MKIKIINPNTTLEMTRGIEAAGRLAARPGTEILAVSPESGPASIESYYDEYLCIPGVLDEVRKGEQEGADAYVIACYGDPGLQAAREVTEAPVVGIAEASLYMASMLAARFSIVTVLPRIRTMLEEMVDGYGMTRRVVSIRTTPLCVLDIEEDPEHSWQMVRDDARRAVEEDDAEAVLLGCAGMADFANSLEEELGVPVIDGVVAAVKFAEGIVDLGKKTSKLKTYKPPEKKGFTGAMKGFGTA
ncbi:aspartate/glutamate racemase family protein [Rubrobacter marinus]|uniref:Hydantoin racemase n=1 Tax=Rubrobacter marinus TaxID=2653852 RepID=A0A6G8Q0V7_9ACTN|nr:aspartate/glutamate racemase family protein [Rubrobacter marinus]QIN80102.1 aspartate/glutamate racemase family protein [Rubrobacter marinus]